MLRIRTQVHRYTDIYIHQYIHIHIHTHIYIYIYTRIYMCLAILMTSKDYIKVNESIAGWLKGL